MLDAAHREAELEECTDVLLLTRSDDFNAVAAADLRSELGHGHVFRVAPDPEEPDLLPPSIETGILGDRGLTYAELSRLFAEGARFLNHPGDERAEARPARTEIPLAVVDSRGRLRFASDGRQLDPREGDAVIVLAPTGTGNTLSAGGLAPRAHG